MITYLSMLFNLKIQSMHRYVVHHSMFADGHGTNKRVFVLLTCLLR